MNTPHYWDDAIIHLSQKDKVMAAIIGQYKGELLKSRGDAFNSLARSIVGQQISVKAAQSVWNKLEKAVKKVNEKNIHKAEEDILRSAGLSGQKVKYMKSLSEHFINKTVDIKNLHEKNDEEVIKSLTQINGIGRWTAEMFLIFHMMRPDVFPVADIGLQKAIHKHYKKKPHQIGNKWKPYRSVATWYLWRSLDPLPVEY